MCQFNLAIIDKESDDSKLKDIFESYGFDFSLLQNQNLSKLISPDLKVIFTTKSHCDCGSAIGIDTKDNSSRRDIEKEIKKLKRKKWSDSKIQRYLDNKAKTEEKNQAETGKNIQRELDNWLDTINGCFGENLTKKFGILTHFYSGTLENEKFYDLSIINCRLKDFHIDSLKELEFDKILLIRR